MEVWKATHMKSNATWCILKGEEIMWWCGHIGAEEESSNNEHH
ncbi:hypothetical protein AAZX31_17G147400 [Glycine max]